MGLVLSPSGMAGFVFRTEGLPPQDVHVATPMIHASIATAHREASATVASSRVVPLDRIVRVMICWKSRSQTEVCQCHYMRYADGSLCSIGTDAQCQKVFLGFKLDSHHISSQSHVLLS